MKHRLFDFLRKHSNEVYIILISCLVTGFWFRSGKLIASGEESLSLFNSVNIWDINGIWAEIGLGMPNPTYLPRIPISYLIQFLSHFHLPMWSIQAIVFCIFISSGLISMYYLLPTLFPEQKIHISFLASLFYFFNLYAMSQIWGRFLYAAIALWAYLPALLLLWIRWLETGKVKYIGYSAITSIIYSVAFVQPASIITLLAPLLIYSATEAIKIYRTPSALSKVIIRSIAGLATFALVNVWWIYPYATLGKEAFQISEPPNASFDSLRGVSQYFKLEDVIQLRQRFLLGPITYHGWYTSLLSYALSIIVALILFVGITTLIMRWKKCPHTFFLVILFFFSLFISKGSNFPFGYKFYNWLFNLSSFTHVFRNPYEKFGTVFLLAYTCIFAVGITETSTLFSKLKSKYIIGGISLCCAVLVWPIFTGDLFGGQAMNTRITIPRSYQEANNYISKNHDSGRILFLPIIPGDSVQLDWGKNNLYAGVEPSEYIFHKPVIAKTYRTRSDKKYLETYTAFLNKDPLISKFEEMNIKYLVVRTDIKSPTENISSPSENSNLLQSQFPDAKLKKFGTVEVYTLNIQPRMLITTGKKAPTVKEERISPTHYKAHISSATEPFQLILKQTFSPHWHAVINAREINDHKEVYNYANAWNITKQGNYSVDLNFKLK